MKKITCILILVCLLLLTGCSKQSMLRSEKDRQSSENGLNRVLTVYDQNGNPIKTYEGKFDIDSNSGESGSNGSKIKFDIPQDDGTTKRIIIYNAVVICEEK